ncbi:MAG TPA: 23S rRNA (guanosine(2251)-2'-O)-methyltransferase RlmB [Pyrinomonadaceae bacterium]|nr:23S rRNA (guanosine(2251)-2'-O)-methyltransferase RlmB [Pyrinomonadaceae bacterium]
MKKKSRKGEGEKGRRGEREKIKSGVWNPESGINKDRRPKPEDREANSIIYGVLPVSEALRAENRRIEKILIAEGAQEKRVSEIIALARKNGVPFQKIGREDLARMVEPGANHQGIAAMTASADYADADELLEEIKTKENALLVVLDGVEDPRNLGAILRVVECAGAGGVFIPERRAVGLTETVAKTSAGATEYVKVAKVTNLARLIDELKANNIWTIGTSAEAETDYTDWDWRQPSALVLGSEGKGLHRLVAEKCDVLVKIPMQGKIESLNVSVAAGVILFEAIRQREKVKSKK